MQGACLILKLSARKMHGVLRIPGMHRGYMKHKLFRSWGKKLVDAHCTKMFSCLLLVGNDINELYAPNTSLEKYRHFWVLSNSFLAQVCAILSAHVKSRFFAIQHLKS